MACADFRVPSDDVIAVGGSKVQDQVERPAAHLYKYYSFQDPFAAATKKHLTGWDVTETFSFPTPTPLLKNAWKAWLVGYPHPLHLNRNTTTATPVRPLRLLNHGRLLFEGKEEV